MTVRVLVVDDHPGFRRVARAVLARSPGFALIAEARTGEEAMEQARRLRPDLVLLDLRLPGIDGVEAARRITSEEGHPVVVLVSATAAEEWGPRLSQSGASGFIAKENFGPATLGAAWTAAGQR